MHDIVLEWEKIQKFKKSPFCILNKVSDNLFPMESTYNSLQIFN